MKKTIILVFAAAAALALTGCAKKQTTDQNQNQNQAMEQNQGGGIISSIKDAMGMGKKMRCTYTMKIGNKTDTYVSYIEGKKYKSESEFDGKTQYSVFDGETMYSWNNKDKNGTKMEIKCMEDLNKSEKTEPSEKTEVPKSIEDVQDQFDNAMDTKCESVASIDFTIPTDVVYKDQCEEMKKMMESLKKYQNQMPSGMPNVPGNPAAGNFAE